MTALDNKSRHEVLYFPEEEDWESYIKYHDVKYDWKDILTLRKAKRKVGLLCPDCRKFPPIYSHDFLKIPNSSLYNNVSTYSNDQLSSKKLLYRMEETYWSNWKPKRNRSPKKVSRGRPRPQKEDREFHSDEDAGQQLIDYFAKKNFSSASLSGDERSITKSDNFKTKTLKKARPCPLILEEKKKTDLGKTSVTSITESFKDNKTYSVTSLDHDHITAISLTLSQQPSHITIASDGKSGSTTRLKTFKHIDSFILNKKKKSEGTQHFQQPKSIKLYKKSVKGGSYPLKSTGKKESSTRGNFKLGAPGGSILITKSSFGGSGKRGSIL